MANASMIAASYNNPTQTINSTTETCITYNYTGPSGAVFTVPFATFIPQNANVSGRPFRVRCFGTATGGTSATLTLKLYSAPASLMGAGQITAATAATLSNDTNICAFTVSGAAIATTGGNFDVYADLTWDQVSGLLNGFKGGHTNNTLTAQAAVTQLTTVTLPMYFIVSATFGAALATNTVTVTELSVQQL